MGPRAADIPLRVQKCPSNHDLVRPARKGRTALIMHPSLDLYLSEAREGSRQNSDKQGVSPHVRL